MLKTKAALQVTNAGMLPDDTLVIGEAYIKQWKLPQGQHITLRFGSFRQHVKLLPSAKLSGIRISQGLARRMGLTHGSTLRIQYKASTATLMLGPLIGVLISRDYPHMPDKPFGSITMFCKEMTDACKAQGAYAYFFTPNELSDSRSSVEGWIYDQGWRKTAMPLPDIVSNRLTSRKLENKPSVQHFLREVKQTYKGSVFNEKFLDKHEVFSALKQDDALLRYLPESHLLRGMKTLKLMCLRYNQVFLKPVRGSLGKGIIRITRMEGQQFQAQFATAVGSRKQQFATINKLYSALSAKMKTVRYQVQQGLQLIEIQKRPVDFRALVQKNNTGKWAITSIVARTASDNHFVSNLAKGGTLSTVSDAISRSNLSANVSRLDAASRLRQAALAIAQGIESNMEEHFGELGIDLALDTSGHIWLLEVNSKPSKNDNTPLTDGKIRPSVRMLIQYSRFLSGF